MSELTATRVLVLPGADVRKVSTGEPARGPGGGATGRGTPVPDNVIWQGPEHGDGETIRRAFRRLTGRDFEPGRCQWEEVCSGRTVYYYRDGWSVAVAEGGWCTISRAGEGGGG